MRKRSDRAQAPVSIDLGARAEARFELKGEVPSNSLGRLVDALTDAIRPFTEKRGLRADQIRLQRAEVAIEIARLARKRVEQEHLETKPVPNKILVPLIELASNEDLTNKIMVDRWSSLLASASMSGEVPPLFVQILAQMDGRQARTLSKLMLNEYEQWHRPMTTFFDYYEVEPSGVGKNNLRDIQRLAFKNRHEAYSFLVDWFSRPGCYLYYVEEPDRNVDEEAIIRKFGVWYEAGLEEQLEICCALGVIKCEEVELKLSFSGKKHSVTAIYYHATRIGVDFLECCARDDLALLQRQQKELDDKGSEFLKLSARAHFTPKKTLVPDEKKLNAFLREWRQSMPEDLRNHMKGRKVKRCRLSP